MWANRILVITVIGAWGIIFAGMLWEGSKRAKAPASKSRGVSLLPIFPFFPLFLLTVGFGLNYLWSPIGTWIIGILHFIMLTATLAAAWKDRKSIN